MNKEKANYDKEEEVGRVLSGFFFSYAKALRNSNLFFPFDTSFSL